MTFTAAVVSTLQLSELVPFVNTISAYAVNGRFYITMLASQWSACFLLIIPVNYSVVRVSRFVSQWTRLWQVAFIVLCFGLSGRSMVYVEV